LVRVTCGIHNAMIARTLDGIMFLLERKPLLGK
jgi:hypothetical protein